MRRILITILFLTTISLIKIEAASRVVLCEIMTSTTCPPCASANPIFDNWLKTYQNANRVAVIKYHTWWPSPGNDPYYYSNITENQTRTNFYQPTSPKYVPRASVDGIDKQDNSNYWKQGVIDRISVDAAITINIKNNIDSTGSASQVEFEIIVDDVALPSGTYVFHTAIVESELNYSGPNGDPVHHYVMRKMYPDANGEVITLSSGETKKVFRTISFNPSWKHSNCKIVAFVQVRETKQILNAQIRSVKDVSSDMRSDIDLPNQFKLFQNYPNPFNPQTIINYQLPVSSHVILKVYDVLGNLIETLINENKKAGNYQVEFDGKKYSSGIYYYEFLAGENRATRKMILMK